jgi:hypothetical protein
MELPHIKRPIVISYSHRDIRIAYQVARSLGMGQNESGGLMGDVWFQVPNPTTIPPTLKFDSMTWVDHDLTGNRPWELDIGLAMIAHSESLLIILTKYSSRSPEVQKEFTWYPVRKPIWIMSIDGESVPDEWKKRPNIYTCAVPFELDLKSMLKTVLSDASTAREEGRIKDAYLLYWEGINLLGLIDPSDNRMANLMAMKGSTEIQLGLGKGAIQSLLGALLSTDGFLRDELVTEFMDSELGEEEFIPQGITPVSAMRAHILLDLGVAHMIARDEQELSSEDRKEHLMLARVCWQDCLHILEGQARLLRRLPGYLYDNIRQSCLEFLESSAKEM